MMDEIEGIALTAAQKVRYKRIRKNLKDAGLTDLAIDVESLQVWHRLYQQAGKTWKRREKTTTSRGIKFAQRPEESRDPLAFLIHGESYGRVIQGVQRRWPHTHPQP